MSSVRNLERAPAVRRLHHRTNMQAVFHHRGVLWVQLLALFASQVPHSKRQVHQGDVDSVCPQRQAHS